MSAVDEAPVRVERRGPALVVALNRPARRNAINQALADGLYTAFAQAEADPQVRAGVLVSSTPGMFCAGGDLIAMAEGEKPDVAALFDLLASPARKTPWIAAVDGPVLGGGLEISLACEMIVAAETAAFGLPEPRRGILAAGGGVFRLPRWIPRAVAMELVLTGRAISAARAYDLGLVNRVTPRDGLLDAALDLAAGVADCAPASVKESLAIVRAAHETPEDELWTQARAALARLRATDDHREGLQAFAQKRPPVWGR
jgi:enoyl-CoA hydratase/carnithine racemase